MPDIYLYNNEMWRVKYQFPYTGQMEPFRLNPGRYLCICKGAKGGYYPSRYQNRGGCSYGILNLESPLNAYAVVGGDGGDAPMNTTDYGEGGYNGGGHGGMSCNPGTYRNGAGGGGASDIRLSNEGDQEVTIQHQVPDWLTEVEYIRSDKTQYIDTGVIGTNGMGFDIKFTPHNNMSDSNYGTIFGAESGWRSQEYILTTYTYTGNSGHFGYGSNNIPEAHMVKDVETVMSFHNGVLTVNDVDYSITEPASFTTPNAITIFQLRRPSEYREAGTVTLKYFKLFNPDGECIRYFVPFVNTGTEIDISNIQLSQGTVGTSTGTAGADDDDPSYYSIRVRSQTYIPIDPEHKYISVSGTSSTNLEMFYVFYNSERQFVSYYNGWVANGGKIEIPAQAHYFRFVIRRANGNDISVSDITSVGLKYYESTVVSGLYDLVNDEIYGKGMGNDFTVGNPVQTKTIYNETKIINIGLMSRIMVAGGAGGQGNANGSNDYSDFTGYGGGVNGGYPCVKSGLNHNGFYPTQTSGYAFGQGESGLDKTESTSPSSNGGEGIAGAGGGWYGGYASNTISPSQTYSSGNGGGGSGYILSSTSVRPTGYMYGLPERNDLEFTDTLMTSGLANEACVIICEPTTAYLSGERLICDCIGYGTKFKLYAGRYKIRCSGGQGAHRTKYSYARKGGYSEGTLTLPDQIDAYAYVGGSGMLAASDKNAAFVQATHPTLCFNGGGKPSGYGSLATSGEAAGGGTDLRIGTDSLYARVIVAGGAGGCGRFDCYGGAGGGLEGNYYNYDTYGSNPGPGKQSSGGGGFGYGGNGVSQSGGYGGAGGGGWYGGGATTPDGSGDDDKGGCGGSGYVLTADSYKPDGYLLDETYYLEDTSLVTGGQDKLYTAPITGMVIDVIEASTSPIIAHDNEGYKYYDEENHTWTFLQSEDITVADFETYGSIGFKDDTGLGDHYDLYSLDTYNLSNTMKLTVLPPPGKVKFRYHTPHLMSRFNVDSDVDDTAVDFDVTAKRRGAAEDSYIYFTFNYDLHDIPTKDTRVYCIQGFTQGSSWEYHPPHPVVPVDPPEHRDLMPVGSAIRMPARFKNYIGSFINGSEAITTINSAVVCEHNRCIYSATLCNDSVVRFAKLNLVSNTSTVIKDIPKSQIGNTYYGDIKVDDNYIYLTSSVNDGSYALWRTPNGPDTTVNTYQVTNDDIHKIQAVGKMEWYNDHTLMLMMRKGLALFDTQTASISYRMFPDGGQNNARRDWALGKYHIISLYNGESDSAWIINPETGVCESMKDVYFAWAGSYKNNVCYHDGKFYVVQRNRLHVVDDETFTLELSIPTPFTTIDPKQIVYGNGILYITIQGQSSLYMYDIATQTFYATSLPFKIDNWLSNGWIRACAFRGYCFVPQIRLYTINFVDRSKYNLGYKYDQFVVIMNKENSEIPDNQYEYDDRYVTFTEDNMWLHDGVLSFELEEVDPTNHIKMASIDKELYNKIISSSFAYVEPEEDESEGT